MFKLRTYTCIACDKDFDYTLDELDSTDVPTCPTCKGTNVATKHSFAGYQMSGSGTSTRPRYSGSFKRKK